MNYCKCFHTLNTRDASNANQSTSKWVTGKKNDKVDYCNTVISWHLITTILCNITQYKTSICTTCNDFIYMCILNNHWLTHTRWWGLHGWSVADIKLFKSGFQRGVHAPLFSLFWGTWGTSHNVNIYVAIFINFTNPTVVFCSMQSFCSSWCALQCFLLN